MGTIWYYIKAVGNDRRYNLIKLLKKLEKSCWQEAENELYWISSVNTEREHWKLHSVEIESKEKIKFFSMKTPVFIRFKVQ